MREGKPLLNLLSTFEIDKGKRPNCAWMNSSAIAGAACAASGAEAFPREVVGGGVASQNASDSTCGASNAGSPVAIASSAPHAGYALKLGRALPRDANMTITPRLLKGRWEIAGTIMFLEQYSIDWEPGVPTVCRFGINCQDARVKGAWDRRAECEMGINECQREVLQAALEHLQSGPASAVVLDVFVLTGGPSALTGPQTHSTALLKPPGGDPVLVLDPNSSCFSDVLGNGEGMAVTRRLSVYKRPANGRVGPGPSDWRDCVDIAVKMCLRFITGDAHKAEFAANSQGVVPTASIAGLAAIKCVTNQSGVDRTLPPCLKEHAWRVGQSSDFQKSDLVRSMVRDIGLGSERLASTGGLESQAVEALSVLFSHAVGSEDVEQYRAVLAEQKKIAGNSCA